METICSGLAWELRPPRAPVVASKLSESQYANFDCRNVSRSERPQFAYEGTIEYYQHYMQALGLENINIYHARTTFTYLFYWTVHQSAQIVIIGRIFMIIKL